MSDRLHDLAQRNFRRHLAENSYPGRGIVIGRLERGDWIQLYWIMGRSANSRNRKLVSSEGELRTEPLDAALVEDPTNIIYEAMLEAPDVFVVSNGDQTRTILNALAHGDRFEDALATREREDDAPNYTPRIAGLLDLRGRTHQLAAQLSLAILRANDADAGETDRTIYRPALPPPGLGQGLTTYAGDGSPLPPFRGDPLWLPLVGNVQAILDTYWQALDTNNRIALAVKQIPTDGGETRIHLRGSGAE